MAEPEIGAAVEREKRTPSFFRSVEVPGVGGNQKRKGRTRETVGLVVKRSSGKLTQRR